MIHKFNFKQDNNSLALFCKAISHINRIKILNKIIEESGCACNEIVSDLGFSQSTISQHINILLAAGLIIKQNKDNKKCYCINKENIKYFKLLVVGL